MGLKPTSYGKLLESWLTDVGENVLMKKEIKK